MKTSAYTQAVLLPRESDWIQVLWPLLTFIALFSLNVSNAQSVVLTPETIRQVRNLPRADQEALAREYGINPSQIGTLESSVDGAATEIGGRAEPIQPQIQVETESRPKVGGIDGRITRFGANFFDTDVSTFAPVDNIPVPEGYLLGPGDTLKVGFFIVRVAITRDADA